MVWLSLRSQSQAVCLIMFVADTVALGVTRGQWGGERLIAVSIYRTPSPIQANSAWKLTRDRAVSCEILLTRSACNVEERPHNVPGDRTNDF